jgi:hypothetical protein
MSNDTLQLTDQKVLNYATDLLEAHLPLEAEGYCCTTADLLDVLLGVAVNQRTVESVCADLTGTPDPETIRRYLNEQLVVDDLAQLEQGLNAALTAQIPSQVKRRGCELAIDFHDRPDPGKTPQAEGLWVRGIAKNGTTRFYRVATAYVLVKDTRFTLAVRFVLPEEDTVTVLNDLLQYVRKTLRIRIKVVFLDRGFDGTPVMAHLTRLQQPAAIACTPSAAKPGVPERFAKAAAATVRATPFAASNPESLRPTSLFAASIAAPNAPGAIRVKRAGWFLS